MPGSLPRTAVVVPGRLYGPYTPLLMFAGGAAEARGAQVRSLDRTPPAHLYQDADPAERSAWVVDQVRPVVDALDGPPLLVGKSLGSYAATLAAQRGLAAVWLTPLLRDERIVRALRASSAPCLLVGGTADPAWDGPLARGLSPHVLEIDGADHGMFVPGPLAASAAVLGLVVTAVERFLDEVVWR